MGPYRTMAVTVKRSAKTKNVSSKSRRRLPSWVGPGRKDLHHRWGSDDYSGRTWYLAEPTRLVEVQRPKEIDEAGTVTWATVRWEWPSWRDRIFLRWRARP